MNDDVVLGWNQPESPFHAGSRAIQASLGVAEKLDQIGRRAIRPFLLEQHRSFYAQLPFLLIGSVDKAGQPWASIVIGPPGFAQSLTSTQLSIHTRVLPGDPLQDNLRIGADIGLLGIKLPTRRRNRLNGQIAELSEDRFSIAVAQSFGNCPKYIQARTPGFVDDAQAGSRLQTISRNAELDRDAQRIISAADTFFIATAYQNVDSDSSQSHQGIDVSHRGGRPGFVHIENANTLIMPDFVGNYHFRTLGNLMLDARAGLLFIDFATGDLLYLAVTAEIIWDGPRVAAFAGAERLVRFHLRSILHCKNSLPLRFGEPEYSPVLAGTGCWR